MFEKYHLCENAKIISRTVPGEESQKLLKIQNDLESNNRSYPRGIPVAFETAKGANITDVDGNIYLDFLSGCGVFNLGHNNSDIWEEINKHPNLMMQVLDFPTRIKIEFIQQLMNALPESMRGKYKVNFGSPSGADAVEAALKLARVYTGRHTVLSFQGSYHGMTMGALSVTSDLYHRKELNPLIPGVHFMPYCSPYRCPMGNKTEDCNFECIHFIRNVIENPRSGVDKPGAMIVEPVQCEGGTYIPKEGWLEQVTDIARKNGIIVIFDEIQAGFYRTGKLFSFEYTRAVPDIVTVSKSVGGIGFPISLIIFNKELDKWEPGTHIGTFRGNQLAMAAGLYGLKFVEKTNLPDYVKEMEGVIFNELASLQAESDFIGEVRGRGMLFGIEYVKDRASREPFPELAKKLRELCYQNGMLVELGGYYSNVVRFMPPLIITPTMLKNGLEIFKKANSIGEKQHRILTT